MPDGPTRMCAGCRKRRPKHELIRFSASGDRLQVDPLHRGGGRGVYLCPQLSCVEHGVHRGGVSRGLRRRIVTGSTEAIAGAALDTLRGAADRLRAQALADGRARWGAEGVIEVADWRTAMVLGALAMQIEELRSGERTRGEGVSRGEGAPLATGIRPRQGGTEGERSDL